VLFKRNGLKFWLIFLEKFGMPTAVGKYDTEQPIREGQAAAGHPRDPDRQRHHHAQGHGAGLLEAGRSGTADYKALQDYMDATIQKVVLGQTASTQGTPGKLGNDQLQREVRRDIITSDADLVCESFNKGPARWLTEWNFPGAAIPRVYRVTEEPEDLDATASRDKKISTWATSPSRSTWIRPMATTTSPSGRRRIRLRYRRRSMAPSSPMPAVRCQLAAQALSRRLCRRHPEDADPAVELGQQLDRRLSPIGAGWVEQIRQLVDEVDSLEQLRDRLFELHPNMTWTTTPR
jgi:phage gp29-like protein